MSSIKKGAVFFLILLIFNVNALEPPVDLECCDKLVAGYPGYLLCGENNLTRQQCQDVINEWQSEYTNPYGELSDEILIAAGLFFFVMFYVWHRRNRKKTYEIF